MTRNITILLLIMAMGVGCGGLDNNASSSNIHKNDDKPIYDVKAGQKRMRQEIWRKDQEEREWRKKHARKMTREEAMTEIKYAEKLNEMGMPDLAERVVKTIEIKPEEPRPVFDKPTITWGASEKKEEKDIEVKVTPLTNSPAPPESSEEQETKIKGLTDESIILRCRSHKISADKIDTELGDWVQWKDLQQKMKPGDELWYFCTPPKTWENLMGWEGYALFRGQKLIGSITTRQN